MCNTKDDQDGGILDYCLDLLTQEQKTSFEREMQSDELLRDKVKKALNTWDMAVWENFTAPRDSVKNKVWSLLENIVLENQMDPAHLPLINKFTNFSAWHKIIDPLVDKSKGAYPFIYVLRNNKDAFQLLIKTSYDIPDESHDDVQESFIILEGECECLIGDKTVRVKAGEYMEIPLHTNHTVTILSPYVVGIIQRVGIAA